MICFFKGFKSEVNVFQLFFSYCVLLFKVIGFVNKTAPALDGKVGIGANGKLDAAKTGFGECVHIETAGRYTYYTIKITREYLGESVNESENEA